MNEENLQINQKLSVKFNVKNEFIILNYSGKTFSIAEIINGRLGLKSHVFLKTDKEEIITGHNGENYPFLLNEVTLPKQ